MITSPGDDRPPLCAEILALRDTLCQLYQTQASARRICDEAQLETALVAWDGRPRNFWHSIIHEAINQHRLADLVAAARTDYPEVQSLEHFHRRHCPP